MHKIHANGSSSNKNEVAAVVLAAGAARRFGKPKQLERWPSTGPTLLEYALLNAQACATSEIIVVTGNAAEQVTELCQNFSVTHLHPTLKIITVYNPRWAEGQGFSVATGVQRLEESVAAAIFFLADQPRLAMSTGQALVATFHNTSTEWERSIIFPIFSAKRGNPVLFGRAHFAALARLEGDVGGRAVVKANPECVHEIEVNDPAIHEDIDTPQDLLDLS